jgi:hypothetical protein
MLVRTATPLSNKSDGKPINATRDAAMRQGSKVRFAALYGPTTRRTLQPTSSKETLASRQFLGFNLNKVG